MSTEPSEQPASAPAKEPGARSPEKPSRRRRIIRWALVVLAASLVVLVSILVLKTVGFQSRQPLVQEVVVAVPDPGAMAQTLARSLQFETVSDEGRELNGQAFLDLHEHLRVSYPRVHSTLKREVIGDYSLLYTWAGSDPKLPALILAAHLDVVPASAEKWSQEPYSGAITDGYVYGRGALDDKVNVLGALEAAEQLLREGFAPKRTIYFAFGHDEEVGGYEGAKVIADTLVARGVKAEAVVDEGLVITEGILDGIQAPVAVVGIAEKGYVNIELVAQGQGGHSSMPPRKTAIGELSRAILKLEDNPMPASISGSVREMFRYVGPEFSFARRLVMANFWLFERVVEHSLTNKISTDALLRTTTAPTIIEGGVKSNVLAQSARAVVNFRIKPGDTVDDVLRHVRGVVSNENIQARALLSVEAQGSSSTESRMFSIIQRSVRSIDPGIIVAPGLMLGVTDSRHYTKIAADIYRFSALRFRSEDLKRLHGVDERVAIAHYTELVKFQILLLRSATE